MSQAGETFFTSVGCMDGRALRPVRKYGKAKFGVWYVDTVTEAGLVGLLAKAKASSELFNSIKSKILISLEKHHSKGIIVHGHQDCAGNPVSDKIQEKNILDSVKKVREMVGIDVEIIPLFVKRGEEGWVAVDIS